MDPEQKLVIRQEDVMNGFCWAYCNALLQKLVSLNGQNDIFMNPDHRETKKAIEEGLPVELSEITMSVIVEIEEQINVNFQINSYGNHMDIERVITICKEFLDIFRKKNEPVPGKRTY